MSSCSTRWDLVEVTDELIEQAADLAEAEPCGLRRATHLGAALLVDATVLTSADEALCSAAGRRGSTSRTRSHLIVVTRRAPGDGEPDVPHGAGDQPRAIR